jgi:hypothetical protein
MDGDLERSRAERRERAEEHRRAERGRREEQSKKAQVLIDEFVAHATASGIATEELTARPWSGRGRYRTGVVGWYLRRDRSVGVGADGSFYALNVPPVRFGRWRTVPVEAVPPPLQVGEGARDGESIPLAQLLELRLQWESEA